MASGSAEEAIFMPELDARPSRRRGSSADSITYRRDPFNKPELVNTLRGKELCLFVVIYIVAVVFILAVFESVMPVIFADLWGTTNSSELDTGRSLVG